MTDLTPEQIDRLTRWVGAYRRLMMGGSIGPHAHTAAVGAFADAHGNYPYITPDDIEALLLAAQGGAQ